MSEIRKKLIAAGVKNLKEYGYPKVDEKNILTDEIYSVFFKSMLKDNLGKAGKVVDAELETLISEIKS